jgi:purine-binding chemotaxis protein CheW
MAQQRDDDDVQILAFELGDGRFAVPLEQVVEVVRAVAAEPLHGAPAVVEGAIVYRGDVIPLLDIRTRFRIPRAPLSPDHFIVIARIPNRMVAIRIDRPRWIDSVDRRALKRPAEIARGLEHLTGVAQIDDGVILLHDLATFLDEAETATLDRALAEDMRQ